MIKINLNKTQISDLKNETKSTGLASGEFSTIVTKIKTEMSKMNMEDIGFDIFLKIIINLILILCFPMGLKIYEINQINNLEKVKKQKEDLLNTKNQQLVSLSQQLKAYDHLQNKAEEYSNKKTFLKKIAENRIIIARTLDIIQNKTPETVWLKNLSLELQEDYTQINLSGKSFSEGHINSFANSLNDVLDRNSITVDTRDVKEGNSVTHVEFQLKGII